MSTAFDQASNPVAAEPASAGTYDQTFATSGRARLHLDNPRGHIRIVGWDRSDVHVHAVKRHDASSARYQATQVLLSQDGDTVVARTVLDPSTSFVERGVLTGVAAEIVRAFADLLPNNAMTTPVDYDIQVPFESELDVHAVSGDIAVEHTRGAFKLRTVSGAIRTLDVAGDADLGSVSGEIDATGLAGRVHVEEVSGDTILAGNVTVLHARTVSGEIELAGPLSEGGEYSLKSVSGAVTLRVPDSTSASIAVRGVSPDVQSDLSGTVTHNSRGPGHREWEGQLGRGGASVKFHTVSGNLYVRRLSVGDQLRANPNPPAPAASIEAAPSAVSDAPPSASTAADAPPAVTESDSGEGAELRILSALERGELSVDEALRRLETLRGQQEMEAG